MCQLAFCYKIVLTAQFLRIFQVFVGNSDTDTPVTHIFDCPFVARYVRVDVVNAVGITSMRWDLIGCPTNAGMSLHGIYFMVTGSLMSSG